MTGFDIRVDDAAVLAGLKAARGDINAEAKRGLSEVSRDFLGPRVRREAPYGPGAGGHLRDLVKPGATSRTAYVEIRSPYIGLTEFGGTRRDVIGPVSGRAVMTPAGPRAKVGGARRYTGQHFMEKAVRAGTYAAIPLLRAALLKPFLRRLG